MDWNPLEHHACAQHACVNWQVCQLENHRCTWNCQTERVIGNMWRCLSSGMVHVCDQNCKQRLDYGPNEEICFISRRVFPKSESRMTRKRQRFLALGPDPTVEQKAFKPIQMSQ